jgi:hypothetical protein
LHVGCSRSAMAAKSGSCMTRRAAVGDLGGIEKAAPGARHARGAAQNSSVVSTRHAYRSTMSVAVPRSTRTVA